MTNRRKIRNFITSPAMTAAMLVCAVVLLLGSSVGGARAALTYYSENYTTRVSMKNIGVTLSENGERLSWRDYSDRSDGTWDENRGTLSLRLSGDDGTVKPGEKYGEALAVKNSGDIEAYVRVVITRYWEDADGHRFQDLTPDLIVLGGLGEGSGWIEDTDAATDERTVLYYTKPLAVGESTTDFLTSVMADRSLADKVVKTEARDGKYTVITESFAYDGVRMGLEIEADAVQTHSAADAIWSAWGRRVNISGSGILSLR